jgi:hypothetical protein
MNKIMNFLNIMNNCPRFTSFFVVLLNLMLPLYAGVSYAVNVTGDGIIDGYINISNTITITVTFDGGDETTYNRGTATILLAWSENSDVPNINLAGGIDDCPTCSDEISSGSATLIISSYRLGTENESGDPFLDNFDLKIRYEDFAGDEAVGNIDVDDWGNIDIDGQGYLTLARKWPWPNLRVKQASDSWSNEDYDGQTFSLQKVRIDPDIALGSHVDYPSYIFFLDSGTDYYPYQGKKYMKDNRHDFPVLCRDLFLPFAN